MKLFSLLVVFVLASGSRGFAQSNDTKLPPLKFGKIYEYDAHSTKVDHGPNRQFDVSRKFEFRKDLTGWVKEGVDYIQFRWKFETLKPGEYKIEIESVTRAVSDGVEKKVEEYSKWVGRSLIYTKSTKELRDQEIPGRKYALKKKYKIDWPK